MRGFVVGTLVLCGILAGCNTVWAYGYGGTCVQNISRRDIVADGVPVVVLPGEIGFPVDPAIIGHGPVSGKWLIQWANAFGRVDGAVVGAILDWVPYTKVVACAAVFNGNEP